MNLWKNMKNKGEEDEKMKQSRRMEDEEEWRWVLIAEK
jgi:hypothetical protein